MDNIKISPSLEDYLECVLMLEQKDGQVRVKDIAKNLNVRMPSVNNAITMLKKHGLVDQEPYGNVEITAKGKTMAASILKKHRLLTEIFIAIGVAPDTAENDACCVEHVISEETFAALQKTYEEFKNNRKDN